MPLLTPRSSFPTALFLSRTSDMIPTVQQNSQESFFCWCKMKTMQHNEKAAHSRVPPHTFFRRGCGNFRRRGFPVRFLSMRVWEQGSGREVIKDWVQWSTTCDSVGGHRPPDPYRLSMCTPKLSTREPRPGCRSGLCALCYVLFLFAGWVFSRSSLTQCLHPGLMASLDASLISPKERTTTFRRDTEKIPLPRVSAPPWRDSLLCSVSRPSLLVLACHSVPYPRPHSLGSTLSLISGLRKTNVGFVSYTRVWAYHYHHPPAFRGVVCFRGESQSTPASSFSSRAFEHYVACSLWYTYTKRVYGYSKPADVSSKAIKHPASSSHALTCSVKSPPSHEG